jgi:two-component system nitrate/nitrite sensor histidine kinase NarX
MIETPLTSVNEQLRTSLWSTIIMTLTGTCVLIGLMLLALRRFVIHPVDELSKGMAEISAGNLEHQVHVGSRDEFGRLAQSFNEMRQRLRTSLADLEKRNNELAVLNEVALTVNQSLDLQHVLTQALETVSTKLDIESGLLFLYNDRTDRFELCAARGTSEIICQEIERRRRNRFWDISSQVAESNQPYYVANMSQDEHFEGLWDQPDRRSYANVPLRSKNKVVGTLALVSYPGKPFPKEILRVVEAVGNEIGIAIENARLYRQLRYMAGLEERERLAREMHDHIAQALGYLNVKASITDDLLSAGQIPVARESLEELRKVAKIVYTDVREAIFNLRAAAASHTDLLPALRDYLEEYRAYYGLQARLEVHREDLCIFSSEVASQVMRIIQEALTNVRKHASASTVWIDVKPDGDQICISIRDDGCGFSPAQVALSDRQHFGLQIMQERASSIGGKVEVLSNPGTGTQVLIRVPAIQDSRTVI